MAEGGYDPTTENKTPWEDHGIDHDDDDDEEYTTPRSSPMKPPPPPEEIEMSQLPREQKSKGQSSAAWVALKKMYPQANKDALEVSYVKMPGETPRLSLKRLGPLEPIGCSNQTFSGDGGKIQIFLKKLKTCLESQSKNK